MHVLWDENFREYLVQWKFKDFHWTPEKQERLFHQFDIESLLGTALSKKSTKQHQQPFKHQNQEVPRALKEYSFKLQLFKMVVTWF